MKKIVKTIIFFGGIILIIFFWRVSSEKNLLNNTTQNTDISNQKNWSKEFVFEDNLFYLENDKFKDNKKLIKLNISSMDKEIIAQNILHIYGVFDKKIIFSNYDEPFYEELVNDDGLYSMNLDGNDKQKIIDEGGFYSIYQYGDNLYLVTSDAKLMQYYLDDKSYSEIDDEDYNYSYFYENYIYYIKSENAINNIWRLDFRTHKKEQVTFLKEHYNIYDYVVFDGKIYCSVANEKLGVINDEKDRLNILYETDILSNGLQSCGNYIFFAGIDGTYKVDVYTNLVEKVMWKRSESIFCINGLVGLQDIVGNIKVYDLEGNYRTKIVKEPFSIESLFDVMT